MPKQKNRRRQIRWVTRVDEAENATLEKKFAKAGGKVGKEEYVRQMLLNGFVRLPPDVDYYTLANEVNKIGVNINQIAKIANSDGRISPDSIAQVLRMQGEVISLVKEALK